MTKVSTATRPVPSGDPFMEPFFSRPPEGLHTVFTDRRLAALKSIFGDTQRPRL